MNHSETSRVRAVTKADLEIARNLTRASGLFDAPGVEHVQSTLEQHLAGGSEELWLLIEDGGLVYCAPEALTDGTWNMLMLLVASDRRGQGFGRTLVDAAMQALRERGVRLLIVETSGTDDFVGAREFYTKVGFALEGRIRDFYAQGDDKIILSKRLV